jgi:hypothetical protein
MEGGRLDEIVVGLVLHRSFIEARNARCSAEKLAASQRRRNPVRRCSRLVPNVMAA